MMPQGSKLVPSRGRHVEHKNKERKNFKVLLPRNWKAQSYDIWCVASPCGSLPSLFIDAPGVKTGPAPGVTSSNKDKNKENFKFFHL